MATSTFVPPKSGGTNSYASNEATHLAERLNAAQVKIKRLHRLEAALVDFFMEVMDRSATSSAQVNNVDDFGCAATTTATTHSMQLAASSEHDTAFARQRRKEQFLKKAEGDPISLLNSLRTYLRIQFTTDSEQRHAMSMTLTTITSRAEVQEKDAQKEIQKLETAGETYRHRIDTLLAQVSAGEREKQRLVRQYKQCLQQLNAELHILRAGDESQQQLLLRHQQEVETLRQTADALLKEKKKLREELSSSSSGPGSNPRGAAGNHPISNPDFSPSNGTPAEHQNLRRALRDYEVKLRKLEAAGEEWKLEVQRLQQQITGYRHNTQAQSYGKLEKDHKKSKALADEWKKKCAESDAELLRTKSALKERETRIQQMKDEYNKLFTALQKIKQQSPHASPSKQLTRHASSRALGAKLLKVTASTSTLQQLSHAGTTPNSLHAGTDPHIPAAAAHNTSNGATATMAETATSMRNQANDNPYLVEHYKSRMELLEKEIDGLQVQIRKMIASEYRYKQKNRLFRIEKMQLLETCDRLRLALDKAVLSSAKTVTNTQKQLARSYSEYPTQQELSRTLKRGDTATSSSSTCGDEAGRSAATSSSCAVNEVKKLRQRNQFLEERYRSVVQSAAASAATKDAVQENDSKPHHASSFSANNPPAVSSHIEKPKLQPRAFETGFEAGDEDTTSLDRDDDAACAPRQLRRPSSIMTIKATGSQSGASLRESVGVAELSGGSECASSFGSLDPGTLQALQQVKTKARVRPQSAHATQSTAASSRSLLTGRI